MLLEDVESVLEPWGTQVELSCRVEEGYRVVWDAWLPSGGIVRSELPRHILRARSEGVTMEKSSATNTQPSLQVNGTIVKGGKLSAACIARSLKYSFRDDCYGKLISIKFYGKIHMHNSTIHMHNSTECRHSAN